MRIIWTALLFLTASACTPAEPPFNTAPLYVYPGPVYVYPDHYQSYGYYGYSYRRFENDWGSLRQRDEEEFYRHPRPAR